MPPGPSSSTPETRDAQGVLGDALLELGRYDEAGAAYRRMVELDGSLASYSRRSGLKNLHGDVEGAIADLELAIRLGKANQSPREAVAWAHWQLGGEHWAVGNLEAAEEQYREALVLMPSYYRGLSGLAQVRAAQGRLAEAAELYRKSLDVIPLPETAAALGDVQARLGRPDEARRQYAVVEYIGTLNAANQAMYNRELALFYADHDLKLERALDLTEREIKERKDIYGYDALAWALYKSGRTAEAAAAMAEALRLGTRDPRLFFHAGMIHARLGDRARAREYLERARALNPRFHVVHAAVADRTLAELAGDAVRRPAPAVPPPPRRRPDGPLSPRRGEARGRGAPSTAECREVARRHDRHAAPLTLALSPEGRGTENGARRTHPRQDGLQMVTGVRPQISSAYCWIVRSLENLPMRATFRIDLRVHAAWSRYSRPPAPGRRRTTA